MALFRSSVLISLITLTLFAAQTHAETWQDDRYQLSMQVPEDWLPMREALLAQTNAQVSHLTGRGFIAGYAITQTDTLVFPYMLVQFKPYSALPAHYRPTAKLSERDQLELLYALVSAFREKGPLPQTIDTPQFIDQFGNKHARLIRLEDDGRFDFTGKIPHEKDQVPILYHTHGILGKDGIALVSVFTVDNFTGVNSVIQEEMRTFGFAKGQGIDALPDEPPAPEPEPETPEPIAEPQAEAEPVPAEPIEPASSAETATDITAEAEETDEAEASASVDNPGDSTALILILSLLGAVLIITVGIVWFITHQKAQAQRERRRIRKERLLAAQASAQVDSQPRPAAPTRAGSHGSTGRHTAGRTRS